MYRHCHASYTNCYHILVKESGMYKVIKKYHKDLTLRCRRLICLNIPIYPSPYCAPLSKKSAVLLRNRLCSMWSERAVQDLRASRSSVAMHALSQHQATALLLHASHRSQLSRFHPVPPLLPSDPIAMHQRTHVHRTIALWFQLRVPERLRNRSAGGLSVTSPQ
ncbi:hypothetical protein CPB85DRAFT_1343542 [Mucidula mucida]|nr:hypothetical protein CPB85DRAFT_1343542 [Mucidula mucida]